MCPAPEIDDNKKDTVPTTDGGCMGPRFMTNYVVILLLIVSICAILIVAELGSLVSLAMKENQPATIAVAPGSSSTASANMDGTMSDSSNVPDNLPPYTSQGENVCEGKKPDLPNVDCIVNSIANVGPQAGANVTKGYQGNMQVDADPITTPFWMNGMCAVNVHWHLGAEHLSVGQYDEDGTGPSTEELAATMRPGHQCNLYDEGDSKFTRPYEWKYCKDMEVGQTYEVHWPHSAAGACGTPNQYQTPFYDGVFCSDGVITDTASQVGVQAQVFVVVNDESYFWPDLIRGMIVDGDMGSDVAHYLGSTTGDSVDNEVCSQYTPITWQVDRQCHMISASSFDKLCYDMLQQRDDMSDDTHPHGSRETVDDDLAANNQVRKLLRGF